MADSRTTLAEDLLRQAGDRALSDGGQIAARIAQAVVALYRALAQEAQKDDDLAAAIADAEDPIEVVATVFRTFDFPKAAQALVARTKTKGK